MKIICENYGCGTSSAFEDYGIDNLVFCSSRDYKHVFDIVDEDLFFVGHEFLLYLWDTELKVKHWKKYNKRKIVWCFEKIDCIVPIWQEKSHYSLERCQRFTDEFVASDEQDCRKYGIQWLPQWASRKFYDERFKAPTEPRIVFSGQAGLIGYERRDELLNKLQGHSEFYVSNNTRKLDWNGYVDNFLNHSKILAPYGNLKAFNTRTFEAIISGRMLLQQVDSEYQWHTSKFNYENVKFFETYEDLIKLVQSDEVKNYKVKDIPKKVFEENTVFSRFKEIGLEL